MITLILIVVFLLVGWLTLVLGCLGLTTNSDIIEVTFCALMGLVAVNITGISLIIHKLDIIKYKIKNNEKDNRDNSQPDTTKT